MVAKNRVFANLVKDAFGLPTSDCCAVPVAPAQQANSGTSGQTDCCAGSTAIKMQLPVVIIGGGPVGLAAAAHVMQRGEMPLVLEMGEVVAANLRKWAHVRMFSPWKYNVDEAAVALLAETGWEIPEPEGYPTGRDMVEMYLQPLSDLLKPYIRLGARVMGVTRQGIDKMKDSGREEAPFLVQYMAADGIEEEVLAKAVIDASGTYATPSPMGAAGIPASGERAAAERIFYGIPDVLGADRDRYAGRKVMVVGAGHSAMNALLALADLAKVVPATEATWVIRRPDLDHIFGGGESDGLPARGRLGIALRRLVGEGRFHLATGFRVARVQLTPEGVVVTGVDGQILSPVDEVIVATGARPDLTILSEMRLALDPKLESTVALAPLIDPNYHSCSVRPHGEAELSHPEPGFYIVGSKSYGRAPTFLMMTGYEQVRSVVAAISGDMESARLVQLELPETGVCCGVSADGAFGPEASDDLTSAVLGSAGGGCCAPAVAPKQTEHASKSCCG